MCNIITPSGSPEHQYKAALAMNNMAITMMERSCYSQAFETLKDAARTMSIAAHLLAAEVTADQDNDDEEGDDQSEDYLAIETCSFDVLRRLQQADTRCANPEPTSRVEFLVHPVSHMSRVHPSDFSARSASQDLTDETVFRLIRIDAEDDVDLFEEIEESFDFCSAIVLYNYAVASLARARKLLYFSSCESYNATPSESAERHARTLTESAVKLLTLCGGMLSRLYESCDDSLVLSRVLFASASLLQLLSKTLHTAGQTTESESCISTLEYLCNVAKEELDYMDDNVAAVLYFPTPAAAA